MLDQYYYNPSQFIDLFLKNRIAELRKISVGINQALFILFKTANTSLK